MSIQGADAEARTDERGGAPPAAGPAGPAGGGEPAAGILGGPDGGSPARSRRGGVTILSKLLAMLLGVSLLSALVAGWVGYRNGTDSLRTAAYERLVGIRESRAREITRYFEQLRSAVILDSKGVAVQALPAFTEGFEELADGTPAPGDTATVRDYYEQSFVPSLEQRSGNEVDPEALLPRTPQETYLQARYTAASDDWDERLAMDDAGDGSAWSAAHVEYHDYFRESVSQLGVDDALLIDPDGNVVYSAYKGVDLGTNVRTGPYAGGALEQVFDQAVRATSADAMFLADLDRYTPDLGAPTGFAASPVGADGETLGVLVYQIPLDQIDALMTAGGDWAGTGLGETGETYLVGPDRTMRSVARGLLEDPEAFREAVIANGTPEDVADREVAVGGSVLLQPVESVAADRALRGDTGTGVNTDYRGVSTLAAWTPLDIDGVQWALVAEVDTREAFAPVADLTRNLVLSVALLVLLVSLASLVLAQVFLRPVRRLLAGVREVAGGNLDARVDEGGRDEFGELAAAFNDMGRSLRSKAELLEEQQAENERMLLSLMPEDVAQRYREGDEAIADEHADVTVVYADLVGLDDFTRSLGSDEDIGYVNALVRAFDEAAERLGMERVRTLRSGYLASCGLVVPRVDSTRRALEFAREMRAAVDAFDAQHEAGLALRAGIHTGTVTSGLVGEQSMVYDLWGDAVNLAYSLRRATGGPGIFVSGDVYDRLRDAYTFRDVGQVDAEQGRETVWELVEADRD
ncbi:adenylate/guanylate cyclase domain-containing protein [Promicromonospora sp. NPDC052451]|uniref:adenylate/guanylate cyclase domain-containing protein n=1 Tax=Promicromonospora sp. NPDC052451 TaxID=3364407 RepID=UPI0037C55041